MSFSHYCSHSSDCLRLPITQEFLLEPHFLSSCCLLGTLGTCRAPPSLGLCSDGVGPAKQRHIPRGRMSCAACTASPKPLMHSRKLRTEAKNIDQAVVDRVLVFLGFPQALRESPGRSKQPKIETLTQEVHRARGPDQCWTLRPSPVSKLALYLLPILRGYHTHNS